MRDERERSSPPNNLVLHTRRLSPPQLSQSTLSALTRTYTHARAHIQDEGWGCGGSQSGPGLNGPALGGPGLPEGASCQMARGVGAESSDRV